MSQAWRSCVPGLLQTNEEQRIAGWEIDVLQLSAMNLQHCEHAPADWWSLRHDRSAHVSQQDVVDLIDAPHALRQRQTMRPIKDSVVWPSAAICLEKLKQHQRSSKAGGARAHP